MTGKVYTSVAVNATSFPWLRGIWLLQQLLEDEGNLLCEVMYTPGHWGVLLQERTVLCLFDNCPQSMHISPVTQTELLKNITSKKNVNNQPELAGDSPCFVLSTKNAKTSFSSVFFTKEDNKTRIMAVLSTGEMLCWYWFQGTERKVYKWKYLQSAVLTEGETISIRKMISPTAFRVVWWETDSKQDGNTNELLLRKIGKQKRHFTHRICYQSLEFDYNTGKETKGGLTARFSLTKDPSKLIVAGLDDLSQFESTNDGIWILTSEKIGFWTYGSQQEFTFLDLQGSTPDPLPVSLSKHLKRVFQAKDIICMLKHHTSGDILLLERSGRVLICSFSSNSIALHQLCVLQSSHFKPDVMKKFAVQRHYFVAFSPSECSVFDIQAGVFLENILLPYSLEFGPSIDHPEAKTTTTGGVWMANDKIGFWKPGEGQKALFSLQATTVDHQVDGITSAMKEAGEGQVWPLNYRGRIYKNWNVANCYANLTLRELYNRTRDNQQGKDQEDDVEITEQLKQQQELAKELLPYSENPALLLLLLKDKYHSQFLQDTLTKFLDKYVLTEETHNAKLNSYQNHTILNSELIPQLVSYRKLGVEKSEIVFQKKPNDALSSQDRRKESFHLPADEETHWLVSGDELVSASRSIFELTLYRYPEESLKLLEEFLQLSSIWAAFPASKAPEQTFFVYPELLKKDNPLLNYSEEKRSTIAVQGERSKQNPLFLTLCRLYLKLQPLLLIPFILLVYQSYKDYNTDTKEDFFVTQAIAALPIFLHSVATEEDTKLASIRTTVQVALLCLGGMGQRAMHYLLERGMWDQIFTVMRKYSQERERISNSRFTPQSELFYILLSWCIQHKDEEHIKLLWEFTPAEFGVLNLLRMIGDAEKDAYSSIDSTLPPIRADVADNLTVGTFKAQIIQMYNTSNCAQYFTE